MVIPQSITGGEGPRLMSSEIEQSHNVSTGIIGTYSGAKLQCTIERGVSSDLNQYNWSMLNVRMVSRTIEHGNVNRLAQ
jgi:hypothetical protein